MFMFGISRADSLAQLHLFSVYFVMLASLRHIACVASWAGIWYRSSRDLQLGTHFYLDRQKQKHEFLHTAEMQRSSCWLRHSGNLWWRQLSKVQSTLLLLPLHLQAVLNPHQVSINFTFIIFWCYLMTLYYEVNEVLARILPSAYILDQTSSFPASNQTFTEANKDPDSAAEKSQSCTYVCIWSTKNLGYNMYSAKEYIRERSWEGRAHAFQVYQFLNGTHKSSWTPGLSTFAVLDMMKIGQLQIDYKAFTAEKRRKKGSSLFWRSKSNDPQVKTPTKSSRQN